MTDGIEIFQDLRVRVPVERRPVFRQALIAAAAAPWHFDLARSADMIRVTGSSADILLFRRDVAERFPAAGLTLWGSDEGYHVPNIVPLEAGSLTVKQYNKLLNEFAETLAIPVARAFDFEIVTSKARQELEDWISVDAALKLRRFSHAANKSATASHPRDEQRWFDFITEVYRSGREVDSGRLARWLFEVEGWNEDTAHTLAGSYEAGLALLKHYDPH